MSKICFRFFFFNRWKRVACDRIQCYFLISKTFRTPPPPFPSLVSPSVSPTVFLIIIMKVRYPHARFNNNAHVDGVLNINFRATGPQNDGTHPLPSSACKLYARIRIVVHTLHRRTRKTINHKAPGNGRKASFPSVSDSNWVVNLVMFALVCVCVCPAQLISFEISRVHPPTHTYIYICIYNIHIVLILLFSAFSRRV